MPEKWFRDGCMTGFNKCTWNINSLLKYSVFLLIYFTKMKINFYQGKEMKRIVLIVPDKIIHVVGTSRNSQSEEIDVNRENITRALEMNAYHENLYFPNGSVKCESVEKI